ncbi:competence/damage-inducible protein A [Paludifilum halophilum]|uniref:Putative competence-damage inducible protein n=1 Tax=Paludifilum halophilum TaxID=1642702 RepID=A0A235BDC7_9BACL|nr:competence/damage-inducible protein A [Paludifilum halophilum]OYD09947.1 competence/damage-inducible protein A [Paludifilum halophilum]
MRAELVAVGTELLLGQIVDTHSAWLSRELSQLGIDVYYHTSVGDNRNRLKEVIRQAGTRSDLVIFTGGLGPTEDDLTKEAVAEVLDRKLVEHSPSIAALEAIFSERGLSIPPSNYKQAFVFEGGMVFSNPNGTAPGVAVTQDGTTYVLLPGPPTELYPMFEREVRSFLERNRQTEGVLVSKVLRFFGIGESHLVERVEDLLQNQENPTIAPLAKEGEVTLRITAKAADEATALKMIAPVREEILRRVGGYVYGEDDETLETVAIQALLKKQRKLALAESCTGGLIAEWLTSVSGASGAFKGGVVSYTNEAKENLLGVSPSLLEEHGAVSMESALAMAEGAQARFNSDLGLSVTGVAGPDPSEGKPVGTVFIGLAQKGAPTRAFNLSLAGSRQKIRIRAAKFALYILQERLKKGEQTT